MDLLRGNQFCLSEPGMPCWQLQKRVAARCLPGMRGWPPFPDYCHFCAALDEWRVAEERHLAIGQTERMRICCHSVWSAPERDTFAVICCGGNV